MSDYGRLDLRRIRGEDTEPKAAVPRTAQAPRQDTGDIPDRLRLENIRAQSEKGRAQSKYFSEKAEQSLAEKREVGRRESTFDRMQREVRKSVQSEWEKGLQNVSAWEPPKLDMAPAPSAAQSPERISADELERRFQGWQSDLQTDSQPEKLGMGAGLRNWSVANDNAIGPVKPWTNRPPEPDGPSVWQRIEYGGKSVANGWIGMIPAIKELGGQYISNLQEDSKDPELMRMERREQQLRDQIQMLRNGFEMPGVSETALLTEADALRREIDRRITRDPADPNGFGMRMMRSSAEYRAKASEGLDGIPRFLVDNGIGIAANAPALALNAIPEVGTALSVGLLSAQAAAAKGAELNDRGYAPGESLARGITAGLIEAATEKFSVESFVKIAQGQGAVTAVKNILRQAGIEASEESASYALNFIADKAAHDPEAEFSIAELMEAAAGGAFSGGFYGAVGAAVDAMNFASQQKRRKAFQELDGGKTADFDAQYEYYHELGRKGGEMSESTKYQTETPIDTFAAKEAVYEGRNTGTVEAAQTILNVIEGRTLSNEALNQAMAFPETREILEMFVKKLPEDSTQARRQVRMWQHTQAMDVMDEIHAERYRATHNVDPRAALVNEAAQFARQTGEPSLEVRNEAAVSALAKQLTQYDRLNHDSRLTGIDLTIQRLTSEGRGKSTLQTYINAMMERIRARVKPDDSSRQVAQVVHRVLTENMDALKIWTAQDVIQHGNALLRMASGTPLGDVQFLQKSGQFDVQNNSQINKQNLELPDGKNEQNDLTGQAYHDKIFSLKQFIPAETVSDAKWFAECILRADVEEVYREGVGVDVLNGINEAIANVYNRFLDTIPDLRSYLRKMVLFEDLENKNRYAIYYYKSRRMGVNKIITESDAVRKMAKEVEFQFSKGGWSCRDPFHSIYHEMGHAVHTAIKEHDSFARKELENLYLKTYEEVLGTGFEWTIENGEEGGALAKEVGFSYYGLYNVNEFVAEAIAQYFGEAEHCDIVEKIIGIIGGAVCY